MRNALVVTTDGTGMHAVRVAVADTDAGHLIVNAVLDGITVHAWRRPR